MGRVGTRFEQYKDIVASLGISASYDDLRTDNTASTSLKNQSGTYSEVSGQYGFTLDKRNKVSCQQVDQLLVLVKAYLFMQTNHLFPMIFQQNLQIFQRRHYRCN